MASSMACLLFSSGAHKTFSLSSAAILKNYLAHITSALFLPQFHDSISNNSYCYGFIATIIWTNLLMNTLS